MPLQLDGEDTFTVETLEGLPNFENRVYAAERFLDALKAGIDYQLVDMMRGIIDEGSGSIVRRLGFDLSASGKTGTTDDYRDNWFTGFTPALNVSVRVGFDRGRVTRDIYGKGIAGGRGAASIWADFLIKATDGEPPRGFSIPPDIRFEKWIRLPAQRPAAGLPISYVGRQAYAKIEDPLFWDFLRDHQ